MKGFVFQEFFDFVDRRFGPDVTEEIIETAELEHDAAYAATGTYPFSDLQKLVGAACRRLDADPADMLRDFGGSVGCAFARGHRDRFDRHDGLFDMLANVEELIHVEVRKLYPEAELPRFQVEARSESQMLLHYRSERKLWDFAKGIIEAAAGHYGETVDVEIARVEGVEDEALIRVVKTP